MAEEQVHHLVGRCLEGEQEAAAALVGQFRGRVFALCYRMLGHRQDAEDVVQESFARALRSLGNWDRARPFVPWLLAIAGNRCRTLLARRRLLPATAERESLDRVSSPSTGNLLREEVQLALAELKADYREAFLLFHEEQLSYAEIAGRLSCPIGSVKTKVHRARRAVIERLRQRGVIEGVAR